MDTLASFDKEDKASHVQGIVLLPVPVGNVWVILIFFFNDFEKHDFAGRSGNKGFVVEEIHLPEIRIGHFLKLSLLSVITANNEGLSLSIERVDLVVISVIETLVRKVLG